jgi:hypothetical protein
MPELNQDSTSPPVAAPPPVPPSAPPIPPERGPVIPPVLPPGLWEEFPIMRETALLYVSEPRFNAALRIVGEMFYNMLLETYDQWPAWPESSTRMEMHAALADMRHLQGFFGTVGLERNLSSLSPADAELSRHASKVARLLNQAANTLERKLEKGAAS